MLCGVIQILCLRLGDQVKPVAGTLWNTLKQVGCVASIAFLRELASPFDASILSYPRELRPLLDLGTSHEVLSVSHVVASVALCERFAFFCYI